MTRSKWKNPNTDALLIKKVFSENNNTQKTYSRQTAVMPSLVGTILHIHNGKTFSKVKIVEEMVGYKLGEFAPTRKKFSFKKSKK